MTISILFTNIMLTHSMLGLKNGSSSGCVQERLHTIITGTPLRISAALHLHPMNEVSGKTLQIFRFRILGF